MDPNQILDGNKCWVRDSSLITVRNLLYVLSKPIFEKIQKLKMDFSQLTHPFKFQIDFKLLLVSGQ